MDKVEQISGAGPVDDISSYTGAGYGGGSALGLAFNGLRGAAAFGGGGAALGFAFGAGFEFGGFIYNQYTKIRYR